MHALVTGGAGFIGSTLVDRLLVEGHTVDVVDNLERGSLDNLARTADFPHRFSLACVDVRSPEFMRFVTRRRPDVLFHLAAQASVASSVDDPVADASVNVLGTVQVLEAAHQAGVSKIVYAASGGTLYAEQGSEHLPLTEEAPRHHASPYGASKAAVLGYLECYHHLYGIETTALALANVYGPRQDPNGEAGVIAIFASRVLAGAPLHVNGDGRQTRDFVYVTDVVDAFVRAAATGASGVFNIGTGVETSLLDLVDQLAEVVGRRVEIEHRPARPGEVRRSALSPRRAGEQFGWAPTTTLRGGITAVLRAFTAPVAA
jgi:UDP-glucose 4-epimerase